MAEYTQSSLKSKIETDLADNVGGGITAATLRTTLKNMVDSVIPITASGADIYFRNDIDIRDNSVTTANQNVGTVRGQWSGNDVGTISFISGDDAINRDNGSIVFKTSASGVGSTTGGRGLTKRMTIDEKGQVIVYGSGTAYPAFNIKSIHGSGLNLLLDHATGNIAVPTNKSMYLGHWASGTSTFSPRMTFDNKGWVGIGTTTPTKHLHVRASGAAVRYDSKVDSNDYATASFYKYKTDTTTYSDDDINIGFGMGVSSASSGVGYLFIGKDTDRSGAVRASESLMVLDSGGNVGIGNRYPREKLEVGESLGRITASGDGNAVSIGSKTGDAHLYLGSGDGAAYLSNYAQMRWEGDKHRFVIDTKSGQVPRREQFVIDSTNGNVGIGNSGISVVHTWRPNHNLHVSASGTSATMALENALDTDTAIHIGKNTDGSGILTYPSTDNEKGHWATIGYKSYGSSLKINNSGSFVPSHLTIDRLGNVGINTDSPYNSTVLGKDKLHVYGENSSVIIGDPFSGSNSALRLVGSRSTNNTAYIQTGTSAADVNARLNITRFDTDGTNFHKMQVYADSSKFHGSGVFNQVSVHGNILLNDKWLSNDGGDEGIRITDAGKVGINVAVPTYELQLSSNSAGKPISSVWSVVSDSRVKTSVTNVTGGLDKINNLRPVKFKYTGDFCDCHTGVDPDAYYYNFIAQEVAVEFPEAVTDSGIDLKDHDTDEVLVTNVKHLDAHMINVYLVSAVKELKDELDAAKERITQLES
jgi:hypothetical protein